MDFSQPIANLIFLSCYNSSCNFALYTIIAHQQSITLHLQTWLPFYSGYIIIPLELISVTVRASLSICWLLHMLLALVTIGWAQSRRYPRHSGDSVYPSISRIFQKNVISTDFMSAYSFVIFHSPYRYFNQLLLLYPPYLIREFKAKLPYWAFLGLIGFSRLPLLGFFPTGASIMATRSPVPYSSIWWHTTQKCWGFPSSHSARIGHPIAGRMKELVISYQTLLVLYRITFLSRTDKSFFTELVMFVNSLKGNRTPIFPSSCNTIILQERLELYLLIRRNTIIL